jgi:hypothetical protein
VYTQYSSLNSASLILCFRYVWMARQVCAQQSVCSFVSRLKQQVRNFVHNHRNRYMSLALGYALCSASVTIRRNPKCSRVLGGARAQGGGTHDSEESTLRRVLRVRGEALHRSRFAGIQVLACARSARACSRSGWFWGILVSKFLCIRFCVLILQYQELDSLVPYDLRQAPHRQQERLPVREICKRHCPDLLRSAMRDHGRRSSTRRMR